MKTKLLILSFLVLAAAGLAVFISHRAEAQAPAAPTPRTQASAPSQGSLVSLENVKTDRLAATHSFIGNIEYATTTRIAAEYAGRVSAAPFEEGDRVKKGATLLTIDTEILSQNISAAKARLAQQRLVLEKAWRDMERSAKLYEEKVVSTQRYQDAKTERDVQEANVKAIEADLKVLEEQLKRSRTIAAYDAVIVKKHVSVGEWVNVGTITYEVAEQRLEAVINIPQSAISQVFVGQKATVTAGGENYSAAVKAVVPQADTVSRTFPVKLSLNYTPKLLGGMDCKVSLSIGELKNVQLVPMDAVVKRAGADVVFTVTDNKARLVPVTVVGYKDSNAGFLAGEQLTYVITRGSESIQDGQAVRVQ